MINESLQIDNLLNQNYQALHKAATSLSITDEVWETVISPFIPYLVTHANPMLNVMREDDGTGNTVDWFDATEGGTPGTWVTDLQSPTIDDSTYTARSVPFKTLITSGKITRRAQKASLTFTNLMLQEVTNKTLSWRNQWEKELIQGTVSSTKPAGIYTLFPSSQTILNSEIATGATLDQGKLNKMIHKAKAGGYYPNVMLMSDSVLEDLEAIVLSLRRQVLQEIEVPGGVIVNTYRKIPIYDSTNVLNTMTFDGASTTALTAGTASEVYAFSTETLRTVYAQRPFLFMCAQTTSQHRIFEIASDGAHALYNYLTVGRLAGVATS